MLVGSSLAVCASDNGSYSFNYDYWGDVQDSPDAYTVQEVYTAADLGLEKNFSNPQGMFAYDNLLYVCDTGNNRIVVLEKIENAGFRVKQIIDEFRGDVEIKNILQSIGYRYQRGGRTLHSGQGQWPHPEAGC